MKVSLTLGPGGTLSRQDAWGCFALNLAMPGFGSLTAGRKIGYFQAALALVGLTLSGFFAVQFFAWYVTNRASLEGDPDDPLAGLLTLWRAARWPLLGFAVYALAMAWSMITSVQVLVAARNSPPTIPS